jgi:hypothetical protein
MNVRSGMARSCLFRRDPGPAIRRPDGRRTGLAALALTLALGACVERGDFGRVKTHSAWNEAVSAAGTLSAAARGAPVSRFAFTDDEEEMRGRAWRFLTPAQDRRWFDHVVAELVATRIVPPEAFAEDITAYHRGLLAADARSPASSYRRLGEDAMADARLIEPFASVASRVLAADGVRLRSLAHVQSLAPADIANAEARVAENRCLIAWVVAGLGSRQRTYRYALEHLVIETPQADAVPVEGAMQVLGRTRKVLDGLGIGPLDGVACAGPVDGVRVAAPPEARPVRPERPIVRKG